MNLFKWSLSCAFLSIAKSTNVVPDEFQYRVSGDEIVLLVTANNISPRDTVSLAITCKAFLDTFRVRDVQTRLLDFFLTKEYSGYDQLRITRLLKPEGSSLDRFRGAPFKNLRYMCRMMAYSDRDRQSNSTTDALVAILVDRSIVKTYIPCKYYPHIKEDLDDILENAGWLPVFYLIPSFQPMNRVRKMYRLLGFSYFWRWIEPIPIWWTMLFWLWSAAKCARLGAFDWEWFFPTISPPTYLLITLSSSWQFDRWLKRQLL